MIANDCSCALLHYVLQWFWFLQLAPGTQRVPNLAGYHRGMKLCLKWYISSLLTFGTMPIFNKLKNADGIFISNSSPEYRNLQD